MSVAVLTSGWRADESPGCPGGPEDRSLPQSFAQLPRLTGPNDQRPAITRFEAQLLPHLALVRPGHELDEPFVLAGVAIRRLDHDAVETISAWLAAIVDGRQRIS
jgi:hypothetical protein